MTLRSNEATFGKKEPFDRPSVIRTHLLIRQPHTPGHSFALPCTLIRQPPQTTFIRRPPTFDNHNSFDSFHSTVSSIRCFSFGSPLLFIHRGYFQLTKAGPIRHSIYPATFNREAAQQTHVNHIQAQSHFSWFNPTIRSNSVIHITNEDFVYLMGPRDGPMWPRLLGAAQGNVLAHHLMYWSTSISYGPPQKMSSKHKGFNSNN
ncbi:hypothetical protein E3N88_08171 [Mikania micrantha]|uniref:Uncharacterized protein n=1 Tax=Mikania micrantha TaxID=192012 RepID=A0A5N6PHQ7_9ASTR|nr:hypothetical protein E3N88_08171 [Mikania micrantha]